MASPRSVGESTVAASQNNTVIGASNGGPIVAITDSGGNVWSIVNGQVSVNSTADPTTADVIELAYINGLIWQENSQYLWWNESTPAGGWEPQSGTPVNPVTGGFFIGNTSGNNAIINVGELTASVEGGSGIAPQSTAEIITTGVSANGTAITVSTETATLIVDGASTIANGATLNLIGAYRTPREVSGPIQNNGAMSITGSTVEFGALSGSGSIVASGGDTLDIESSDGGNTIQLQASTLYIGGQGGAPGQFGIPGGMSFLSPISMDAASSITLNATQATTEVVTALGGGFSQVQLYNGSAQVADLTISGQPGVEAVDNTQTDSVTLSNTDSPGALQISGSPPPNPGIAVFDTTTSQPSPASGQSYSGPVAGLQNQYIATSSDNLDITTTTPNWFVAASGFAAAIDVSQGGGSNVLVGGGGSNFLTGGAGRDTFFVDDRLATSPIWSTIVGFHEGDSVTVWGVTPRDFTLTWRDGQGAPPDTGLTLAATAANRPDANFTLVGYSMADLGNGRLTVSFGTTPNELGLPGSTYMQVTGT